MSVQLLHGDCLALLPTLADGSVDAIVTDPPAGIAFMGAAWDRDKGGRATWIAWLSTVMGECLRVCKPGAYALVWALPRTSHWTATALEDAGWEIRDCITHIFGSGFPKSHNVGDGRGTALKPATEHWWLARKPLIGTVAANVCAYGTGALNIDQSRVGTEILVNRGMSSLGVMHDDNWQPAPVEHTVSGRWPPNLILSHAPTCNGTCAPECPVAELDRQSGERPSGARNGVKGKHGGKHGGIYGAFEGGDTGNFFAASTGGASRFFPTFRYQAKASRAERNRGCAGLPETRNARNHGKQAGPMDEVSARWCTTPQGNHHPTVKPQGLMLWLCRLITPPGGVILDPFMGSGSTGLAAIEGGFGLIGMEREAEYVAIARARCAAAQAAYQPALLEVR